MAGLFVTTTAEARVSATGCERRNNNQYDKLLECVTLAGVREHQAAFQAIADANVDEFYPGSRRAGTEGYSESVEYVASVLENAGWEVTFDEVEFQFVFPALLQQLTPVSATYATGTFTGSGDGDFTGNVIPVDINLVPPRASTSACEPGDFAGLNFGGASDIALVQRGTCSFGIKALNAQNAGAEAVILFNQGNDPTREGLIVGTLLPDGAAVTIPVVGASFADGSALAQAGSTARVRVIPAETRTDLNVIAEKRGARDDNVVMAGAHLDSVGAGPGINDNGSGSAALLEIAQNLGNHKPVNTLRFAWWASEEGGLIGSTNYVAGLSPSERDRIALYLNFDMIGSPNYFIGVYDADQSSYNAPVGVPIPAGSVQIEDVFESYYTMVGEPYDDTEFSGRSDYQAFILAGIPSSGLFTGAEVPKTAEQAGIWGGTAGAQFDPCYHLACDTFANTSGHALDVNSDAVAFAVLTFAYSTETVNGVVGKKVPSSGPLPTPAGPAGTCPSGPTVPCKL
ncbi:MAG: M20/M25/M40 family metallo-hydrolase [Actinomycetota bacterium]|nr:MAG: M20/M25/M40 family metallo-hydrolase [Actinomycetota bacterium]